MLRILLAAICVLGLHGCHAILDIEATTTYINSQVEVIYSPRDLYVFTAPTCGHYDNGYDVTAHVYNPYNPSNNRDFGVSYFAVTNKKYNSTIPPSEIICSIDPQSTYTTTCTGQAGKGDIYVHVYGNNKPKINFALNVTFSPHNPFIKKSQPIPRPFRLPRLGTITTQELRPVINYGRQIDLAYGNRTHIHMKLCASTITTNSFKVTSILQADDMDSKSLIAQAICRTPNCDFDTTAKQGLVGSNVHDLPVNIAETSPDNYQELYVYAVAYNGPLQNGYPMGKFRFGATITPK